MPNQANKSKDKDGIVQKKKKATMPAKDQGTEGNATKGSKSGNAKKENSAKGGK